jgi:hypothetical protein
MSLKAIGCVVSLAVLCLQGAPAAFAQNSARFEALPIEVKFGPPPGYTMIVTKAFSFVDGKGTRWTVPTGTETDGASIPRTFWTLIGGPFEGQYRNAALVHDRYCDTRTRRWQDVHQMFYEGMLASGVAQKRAWLMYQAVATFGPRWPEPVVKPECRLPGGGIDYAKCTENSGYDVGDKTYPAADDAKLQKFLDDIASEADPKDIDILKSKLAKP